MKLVNIGFGNLINASKLVSVVSNDSAPAKRVIQEGRAAGRVIDATQGRKTKSVLFMDSGHIVLSYLERDAVFERISGEKPLSYAEVPDE